MYKLIAILCLTLAFARGQLQNVTPLSVNTEDYLDFIREQHKMKVQDYDYQMDSLKKSYAASFNATQIKGDKLIKSLNDMNERLNSLELENAHNRNCANKYRFSLPTVTATKVAINNCINTAKNEIDYLLMDAKYSRMYLENYYSKDFEWAIGNCKRLYEMPQYHANYVTCLMDVNDATLRYTKDNEKNFSAQMSTARCTVNANIMKTLDCNYSVEKRTITLMSEVNTLIKKCLASEDECKHCSFGYKCPNISYVDRYDVDYRSRTIDNPFYGRYNVKDCVILKIK